MLASNRHDIKVVNGYTVSFSGSHPGTVVFHTPGTTAKFAISTCPHWGILFEGPVMITNSMTGRPRVCKFLLMDLFINKFRFLGHDNADALLEGSGIKQSHVQNWQRFLGEPSVVLPEHLLTLLTDDHFDMFFHRKGGAVKSFCMKDEPQVTGPDDPIVKEAERLRESGKFQPRDCPAIRLSAPQQFPHYVREATINCKRFALVAGQVFGLRLPDEVQFFAYANMNQNPHRSGYRRAIERYILQCSPYSKEELALLRICLEVARQAYQPPGERRASIQNFDIDSLGDEHVCTYVRGDHLIIGFRGTACATDVAVDVGIVCKNSPWMKLPGAYTYVEEVTEKHKPKHIMVTGHSLGGMIAYRVASKWRDSKGKKVTGHIFNPFCCNLQGPFNQENPLGPLGDLTGLRSFNKNVMAHLIRGDPLCAGWDSTPVREYDLGFLSDRKIPMSLEAHSLENFVAALS